MFFEEDEHPLIEPVKGVKYTGTRYNSKKALFTISRKNVRILFRILDF